VGHSYIVLAERKGKEMAKQKKKDRKKGNTI
jgi:hypothetical protein